MDNKDRCIRPRLTLDEAETIIVFLRHAPNMAGKTDVTLERMESAGDLVERLGEAVIRYKALEMVRQMKEYSDAIALEKSKL